VLYVANVDDRQPTGEGPLVQAVRDYAAANGGEVVVVCAKIESELSELDEKDNRTEMLESLGMKEPALARWPAAYHLLGLQSYFTAGEKEIRAWPVPVGATAPQAAGVIHSDFERGFIRAKSTAWQRPRPAKSEAAIKAAGKMRVEGKRLRHAG
jgi:ribosome-binding ATPase YchF (GTP1/OBG family)